MPGMMSHEAPSALVIPRHMKVAGAVSFFADRTDGSGAHEAVMAKGQERSAEPKK
jgi:hypothetical protein